MSKKINHIEFFKLLLYPEETHKKGLMSFVDLCDTVVHEDPNAAEVRAHCLFHYHVVFKGLYKFVKSHLDEDLIDDIYCIIKEAKGELRVKIKFFDDPPKEYDFYSKILKKLPENNISVSIDLDQEKHNTIMLTFCKKD